MACVLIIDDYEAFRAAVAFGLPRFGHTVVGARDAIEAMRLADAHPIDLVLMDLGWPWRTGLAACARLRREPAMCALPVVMMAPRVTVELRVQAAAVGAVEVIVKPFEWPVLVGHVERWTGEGGGRGAKMGLNPFSRLPGVANPANAGAVRENSCC